MCYISKQIDISAGFKDCIIPVSLTSVVCKQMEHVIAGYIHVWEDRDWLYEVQHGFRSEYSRESQIITVCLDISGSLDKAARLDAIIIGFSKAHNRLFKKIARGFKGGRMD
jgi:hypothetical protein